ncbi:tRNA and rRNA cytosine-C5-methylase [Pyrodictium delaneyi]|uniref:tRNA and rRNA cytosine-C5-methylase n=1 Tax=Pyrodictium delaneyi TaxID=1273541 RepID=A0A0N7JCR8_9CREN|nr:RsmB/NOP family class I SAM-dependent RNA methyltransferase [Pyrodictium delaneyi]ALL00153.1 tRNA and rRNA cytosine-C5-methylase [Pyrodictium delaneyi]
MAIKLGKKHVKAFIEVLEESERIKPFQVVKRRVFSKYGVLGTRYDTIFTALLYKIYRMQGILDKIAEERLRLNLSRLPVALRQSTRLAVVLAVFDDVGDIEFNRALIGGIVRLLEARFGEKAGIVVDLYKSLEKEPWRPRSRIEELELRYLLPGLLIKRLEKLLDRGELELFAKAVNTRRPILGFRVNRLKASVKVVLRVLEEMGVEAWESTRVPWHIRYRGQLDYNRFKPLLRGEVVPQDEASAAAGELLGARPGELVVDMCAAPGGKTTHLAEIASNRATIMALDVFSDRMERLIELARKTGTIASIVPVIGDARRISTFLRLHANRVLLDPPCTSTGALAKHPEARWRLTEEAIKKQVERQRAMLVEAIEILKPGGLLLYTVCSVLPEEGEYNIQWILENRKDVELVPLQGPYDESPLLPGTMRAWPHRHDTTGFFYALLRKR